ncbi:MAG TPA: D-alanyl-D-alanine carboxypeptidase/D-alanyl-D-alanine-endopeptidase [Methylophaga aminisulfidivorans]|uniref:D-alanyl-D-alanine carboxypeptidase/D-alanyl-D-alanine-endopeptidase n=1 Tax=Methylophaga aminisulfidivorans TaxID=230105 RepID=A0A7C1W3F3_9GAMM|nr:D-alanyl-D-alanine carboxypeptidase/D-alanyl-D-alanine-endopeptidase [Methylophaga aminisulfidivorans]
MMVEIHKMFQQITKLAALSLFAVSFTLTASPLSTQSLSKNAAPTATDVAFQLVDLNTGKTLLAERSNQLQEPASLQKLVTALAAKLYLNKRFHFVTQLQRHQDDVIIRFGGDPTLTSKDLDKLFRDLRASQSVIKGNLYINGGIFDEYERAIGLPWDNLGVCYSAPSSSISLDRNCVVGNLHQRPDTNTVRLLLSEKKPITINTQSLNIVKSTDIKDNLCAMKLNANNDNHYQIGGCIKQSALPIKLKFAIQNTTSYAIFAIREALKTAGIEVKGKIIRDDYKTGAVIAEHESEPVDQLIQTMLQRSDNLIADNLLKTIGQQYYQQAGSYENGAAAIKHILLDKAKINLDNAVLADGSGLSRNNRLSAQQLINVISYIFKYPKLGLIDDLPVSGMSGTLAYRSSVSQAPLKGQIQAKTGSLYGTYNLAGKIRTKHNKDLLFVQILTNFHPTDKAQSRWPVMQFEKSLYESIYERF